MQLELTRYRGCAELARKTLDPPEAVDLDGQWSTILEVKGHTTGVSEITILNEWLSLFGGIQVAPHKCVSLLTNASDEEILLLHDPLEVAGTKPTTMGDLFFWCLIACGPLKGDKFAPLQATFQKSGATFSVRQRTRRPRALQSLLPKAAMISGNAEAPILMLAASYAATCRPPWRSST